MGAQKSIHAGKAKIDVNVDLTHTLLSSLFTTTSSGTTTTTTLVSFFMGSVCIHHPNLFGRSQTLDVTLDKKGLYGSSLLIAFRRRLPTPQCLAQQSFLIHHTISPQIGVHGLPLHNFSRSASADVNLSRFSAAMVFNDPASSNWTTTTSLKFEHVGLFNDDGRSISRDMDGFPLTCSGTPHDTMVVLKQESRFAKANDQSFTRFSLQIEQGVPVLSKCLIFNRFKFAASKGRRLGPAFLLTSVTGGSIVGDMAPYQAFSIGGPGSVRGYGEGAVGSGRSCLVANTELTLPLNEVMEGAIFMDCGTDMGSGHHVPGNPALRHGKPGSGVGIGYGVRCKSEFGHFQVDFAINAFHQRSVYFGITNIAS